MRLQLEPAARDRQGAQLVILVTPAEASLEDYLAQGFVADIHGRGLDADVMLAEPAYEDVLAWRAGALLWAQAVAPMAARAYAHIWLAGISLGAFTVLHGIATCAHHERIAGLRLLAPYPGTRDVLRAIDAAGGPQAWRVTPAAQGDDERAWWRWLVDEDGKCRPAGVQPEWLRNQPQPAAAGALSTLAARRLSIQLATGRDDRFFAGQRIMADLLAPACVTIVPGGHDWATWRALWLAWLDDGWLAGQASP